MVLSFHINRQKVRTVSGVKGRVFDADNISAAPLIGCFFAKIFCLFFGIFSFFGFVFGLSHNHPQMKILLRLRSITLILLLAVATILHNLEAARRDYFASDKDSAGNADSGNFVGQPEYHDCFITVKEIKRIGGQCVKIKNKMQGCVAGNTLIPFHHDCM